MLRTFFDFRRVSTLIALLLIIALAALMFASAPAATQTAPADATATPTATGTATATATPTATPDPDATATPTATPTATADPNATATPTATATGTATATPTATPTATATVPPLNADYDNDNDGLIEIRTLAQLNAVRYDLNGDGLQGSVSASDWATYTTAFLNTVSGMGCPQPVCTGYELMMDLNFDTDRDGDVDASDTYPNWTPIGTDVNPFNATFKGNLIDGVMPKISNLTINSTSGRVGLFGETGANAHIESVGLAYANVSVTSSSQADIGALVGSNGGKVIACYSTGAITASGGAGSYAGGLIGHQATTATTAASFSRATVSMSIDPAVTDAARMYIYAGGLMGHNSGTITAAYAAGAVKGKGGGSSFIGGLVGDNNGTITASYSIAPVTAATGSVITPGGLVGYNDRTNGAITTSYWDYITSGIDDDSDTAMPEGKSTVDLLTPTSATGIYAGWNALTIDAVGTNNDNPWEAFTETKWHPRLTYGGHTTELSGNQRFAGSGVDGYGILGDAGHPREGITLYAGVGLGSLSQTYRAGSWRWEISTDGIIWSTTPVASTICSVHHGHICGPSYRAAGSTYKFVPRPEHVGKYIRAGVPLTTGNYHYTRVIGKIKPGADAPALIFASGDNPPRIGTAITIASLPSGAVGMWQRCDVKDPNPSGCDYVGSLTTYTPGAADLNHYIRAYIYYKNATTGAWMRASTDFITKHVDDVQRGGQFR